MKRPLQQFAYSRFKLGDIPIQHFLNIFFLSISCGLIVVSVIFYRNDKAFKNTSYWIKHTQEVLKRSKTVSLLTKDLQISSGRYILVKDSVSLENYHKTVVALQQQLDSLRAVCRPNSFQQRCIDSLDADINKVIDFSEEAYRSHQIEFQSSRIRLLNVGQRQSLQDHIDRLITLIEKIEASDLDEIERENSLRTELSDKTSVTLLSGISILIITSIFLVYYYLRKRKIAEDHLFQSEERYKNLVNNVREYAIFLMDPEGKILNWNLGAQDIKGYSAEEITGRNFSVFYTREDLERGLPQWVLEQARSQGEYSTEGFRVKKDGSLFWANILLTALYDSKGKLTGFVKITRDDTYRKKAESEIVKALERERELNELKSNFLTMASHEFRTPLGVIVSSAILIGKYQTTEEQKERVRILRKILSAAKSLTAIIDQFLSVQKIEEGKTIYLRERMNLKTLGENLCSQLQGIVKTGQSLIHTHEGEEVIICDEFILQQILTNLISNAIKYSPKKARIWVSTKFLNGEVTITVKDNGIGISLKDQEHLFERFYRASNSSDVPGTGLGLYIVRKQVEALNGSISFNSYPGKGSEFTVRFYQDLDETNTLALQGNSIITNKKAVHFQTMT